MKYASLLLLIVSALLTTKESLVAQNGLPPGMPVRPPGMPRGLNNSQYEEPQLKANYRITLSAKRDNKAVGEISILTSSPSHRISGPVNADPLPTTINATGSLVEREDGSLTWTYAMDFQIPRTTVGDQKGRPSEANVQYNVHQATGALIIKAGNSYDVLKMSDITYSVTIAPEAEKK